MFVFELLLPGIDEELVFRGIALGMLVAAFGTPWRFLGVPSGWGLVIVTVVFAALHAFARTDGQLTINLLAAVFSAPIGLVLAWIRLRSGSIWPGVLATTRSTRLTCWASSCCRVDGGRGRRRRCGGGGTPRARTVACWSLSTW